MGHVRAKIGNFINTVNEGLGKVKDAADNLYEEASKNFDSGMKKVDDAVNSLGKGFERSKAKASDMKQRATQGAGKFICSARDVAGNLYDGASKGFENGKKLVWKVVDNPFEYLELVGDMTEKSLDATISALKKVRTIAVKVTKQIVDILFIREQVKLVAPNALRAEILAKKDNAVDVGLFSKDGLFEQIIIESDVKISDEILEGMSIEIY